MSRRAVVLAAGLAISAACGDGGTGPQPVVVASVVVQGAGGVLSVGATTQLTAVALDAAGLPLSGRTVSWASLHATVATVSPTGLVTAVALGEATIRATVDGVAGQRQLSVVGPPNLVIDRVWLTQGTQRNDGTIPLVEGGVPPLLNVVGSVNPPFPSGGPPIRIRVYEGLQQIFEDIRPMNGPGSTVADDGNPLHQVLLPASVIRAGMRVEVVANPGGTVPEDRLDDNTWPATGGPRVIAVRQVAPLNVHVVPVHLTVGSSLGSVTPGNLAEYLRSVRQMFPVAVVNGTIGEVFSTDVNFSDGAPAAWTQILPQVDMLRILEGTSRYYVGAIRPPAGVTFVQNGGWGYIPGNPLGQGGGTRTSLVVGVGWFNRASATRELVAHELGHNHGRRHAPCGNPASPDTNYPHPTATLGVWTHDVYSFFAGLAQSIQGIGPQVGFDIMSYCTPVWTSDYTYEALLNVRSAMVAAPPAQSEPCDCLVVWGSSTPSGVTMGPLFLTEAHAVVPGGEGTHAMEGVDASGRVLFTARFTPSEIDHAPGMRQFLFAIPRSMAGGAALAEIRVTDPAGRAALAPQGDILAPPVAARRLTADGVELTWDTARTPGVLVRDPTTRRVLGIGRSGRLVVKTALPELEVTESRGVLSRRSRVILQ